MDLFWYLEFAKKWTILYYQVTIILPNSEPRHVISNNVAFWQVYAQASLLGVLLS